MNKHTQELAEQAGFAFWENESWGPGPGHIDWAGQYDNEFDKFVELMQKEQKTVNTKPLTEALKTWVVTTEEDPNSGDVILPLPEELLNQLNWTEDNDIEFKTNLDGSFTLSKKQQETELVLVDTIITHRVRYMVEVPKGNQEYALNTVMAENAKEFSQECLGEQISSHRVISEEEALALCDKENEYCSVWTTELKKNNFFTSLALEEQNTNYCD